MNDREKVIISTIKLIEKSLISNRFWYKKRENFDIWAHEIFMTTKKRRNL